MVAFRSENPIRVLLLSGPAQRLALQAAVDGGDVRLSSTVDHAAAAVRAATPERVDVCLLDAGADGDVLLATSQISRRAGVAVIVVTETPSDVELGAAMLAGASGYLPVPAAAAEIRTGIREVVAGGSAIPRRFHRVLVEALRTSPSSTG